MTNPSDYFSQPTLAATWLLSRRPPQPQLKIRLGGPARSNPPAADVAEARRWSRAGATMNPGIMFSAIINGDTYSYESDPQKYGDITKGTPRRIRMTTSIKETR